MKKLMILVAMLGLLAVVTVPAMAQVRHHDNFDFNRFDFNNNGGVSQEIGNESESGDVSLDFSVQSSGNNSNQCVTPLQFGNTGNFQNGQGGLQYSSLSDDIEFEGGTFEFAPVLSGGCTQQVQQSSAASSG